MGCGVVLKLDPASGKETVLYTFMGGADGGVPVASLIQDSAGNLYGTTEYRGDSDWGVVFKLDTDNQETVLHSFTGGADGATPLGNLVMDAAGNLYGTTYQGGTGQFFTNGVIFKIDNNDSETVLYTFPADGLEGVYPEAGLLLDSGGNLYGTASAGGNWGWGVVFELSGATEKTFSVSVVLAGSGSGIVTSSPAGIDCGTTCSANFLDGTTVTLMASASPGSKFVGWSGACSGSGECTLAANASVTATFEAPADFTVTPASASLTIQRGGQGKDIITIAPQNGSFNNLIQLSCSINGPSPLPTCALSPSSITPGADSATSTLTVTVPAISLRVNQPEGMNWLYAMWIPLMWISLMFGTSLFGESGKRKLSYRVIAGLLLLFCFFQAGCGGGNSGNETPTPTSYTVTVTGASGDIRHTTQVTLIVP